MTLATLFRCLSFAPFLLPATLVAEPSWIWSSSEAEDRERANFRTSFSLSSEVEAATLIVTCDNGATALVNGERALRNPDWQEPTEADVAKLLKVGDNELLIRASNEGNTAGLLVVLKIKTKDGKEHVIESGEDWQVAGRGSDDWKEAVVMAAYGEGPWGDVLSGGTNKGGGTRGVVETTDIVTLPGFEVEHLYTVPKEEQGSWVSLTNDPEGRLIACDQKGGLFRITVAEGGETDVEPLETPIEGGAHGLLYAFDSLYVMVNELEGKGLWRLQDSDGDDQFDEAKHLIKIEGSGEHGPHAVVLSPDGESLYFACGNHTELPESLEHSRAAKAWGEDHILPRMWDANGHARGVMAPGGYICKVDPDGKNVELISNGYRNEYDIAFDQNGDLFTFDSDMEWDLGAPWYRPTRVNHATSGSEFGWRSGSGKWPTYYLDSLPGVIDIGPGSPTGVVFGTGAKFPEKYQRAFFINDWTYGTMYAVHLIPDGASFTAVTEEFVSARPLPLTDLIISPSDGAMYFAIGGRGTQSALYRVKYVGEESTESTSAPELTEGAKLRREIEKLHLPGTTTEAIEHAWPYLNHEDRFVRFAARVAIERQPSEAWAERALSEDRPFALAESLAALARVGDESHQSAILEKLAHVQLEALDADLELNYLRAGQLALIRMGDPSSEAAEMYRKSLEGKYPSEDPRVNQELAQLLIALDSPTVVSKTLQLMAVARDDHEDLASGELLNRNQGYAQAALAVQASRPNRQQMGFLMSLRNAKEGWNSELRQVYFSWFQHARSWKGGNSFNGFLENIRQEALVNFVPEDERSILDEVSSQANDTEVTAYKAPKGPGRNYTVDDILSLTDGALTNRDFESGKNLFGATACLLCHRFQGEGGSVGPDITGSGNRYTVRDLAENIIDPSKVISDQYHSHLVEKKDGSVLGGRVVVEENDKTFIMMNPFAPNDLVAVQTDEIKEIKPSPVSMMPPGLINGLNEDEIRDLFAYILSAGNPEDPAFKKE